MDTGIVVSPRIRTQLQAARERNAKRHERELVKSMRQEYRNNKPLRKHKEYLAELERIHMRQLNELHAKRKRQAQRAARKLDL